MPKIQSDFYFRWAQDRIQATFTADQELDSLVEYVGVDTTSNTVEIELPDSTGNDVLNGKKILIIDQGNAATNNITIIPNASDTTTIEGDGSIIIDKDNDIIKFELVDNQWLVVAKARKDYVVGLMVMTENTVPTVISVVDTYVDIEGTIVAGVGNERFTFDGDDELTYVGIKPIKAAIDMSIFLKRASAAAARVMKFAILVNDVVIQEASVTMSSVITNSSFVSGISLVSGDTIKIQVKNTEDTANVIITTYDLRILEA